MALLSFENVPEIDPRIMSLQQLSQLHQAHDYVGALTSYLAARTVEIKRCKACQRLGLYTATVMPQP